MIQSLNASNRLQTSMHFYGWKKGLKTGMYYLRTRPAAQAIQFTVDQAALKNANKKQQEAPRSFPTPSPSPSPPRVKAEPTSSAIPATFASASASTNAVRPRTGHLLDDSEPSSPSRSHIASPTIRSTTSEDPEPLSLSEATAKAAAEDPDFAAALRRQQQRQLEEAKLLCSIENKEACVMCSGWSRCNHLLLWLCRFHF